MNYASTLKKSSSHIELKKKKHKFDKQKSVIDEQIHKQTPNKTYTNPHFKQNVLTNIIRKHTKSRKKHGKLFKITKS